MEKQTMGRMISLLRKEQGMTQAELAGRMNVTDKAVSKWERDLSCPDVNSLPKLADALHVTVDELMRAKAREGGGENRGAPAGRVVGLVLRAVTLAMGVAVTVLSIQKAIDPYSALTLLGIGLACAGVGLLQRDAGEK